MLEPNSTFLKFSFSTFCSCVRIPVDLTNPSSFDQTAVSGGKWATSDATSQPTTLATAPTSAPPQYRSMRRDQTSTEECRDALLPPSPRRHIDTMARTHPKIATSEITLEPSTVMLPSPFPRTSAGLVPAPPPRPEVAPLRRRNPPQPWRPETATRPPNRP